MIDAGIGANSASGGYDIDNSCKFEPDNSEYLGKTPTSSGNRRTFTISMWIKRTEIGMDCYLMEAGDGDYNQSDRTLIKFDSSDQFRFGGGSSYERITNRVFRDASAWYHIVMAVDTTDSTAGNRLKLYINGVQETSFGTSADPSQNFQYAFCKDDEHTVGFNHTDNASYFAGYMSEVILIDGQQLDPTSFGEFDEDSGIWKPIDVSGLTFGTNGFYLDFEDSSNLGNDASGGTDFTENNITAADQAFDTPTNNFCTLNILQNYDSIVFTEGATSASTASGGNVKDHAEANMGFSSGKWYMEFYVTNSSTSDDAMFGFGRPGLHSGQGQNSPGNDTYSFGAHNVSRWYYNNQTWTNTGASGWDKGQVIQIAIDADNGKAWQGVNGTYSSGNPSTNTGGFDWGSLVTNVAVGDLLIPVTRTMYTGPGLTAYNFGGYTALAMSSVVSDENGYGSFEYAPPTGFYALCTKNLAEYG
jgi:hypothetical protein